MTLLSQQMLSCNTPVYTIKCMVNFSTHSKNLSRRNISAAKLMQIKIPIWQNPPNFHITDFPMVNFPHGGNTDSEIIWGEIYSGEINRHGT